ncbi:hypothetical protein EV667_3138 [Ancylobacter aquaticus]|uniref:General stress protein 17M-like domain-containing protein n=1 Tax=Ancylobacter aquaticus TaxID=100 RepID=A0A4R1I2V9_ANCAQ|nr:general stress protein [Ancylobacter aquaticus]TCK29118.1 hypothetical protein EV667_3138 [Ancylobacter aquaticus]
MATVSGLFDNYDDALTAVNRLQALGIDRAQISLVANNADDWYGRDTTTTHTETRTGTHEESHAGEGAATGAGIGAVLGGAGGLLTGLGLMAIPGVGPVVAAGWLVATGAGLVAGAAAGGAVGGMVGAMTSEGVPEERAHVYAEGVRRGGTVVSARVPDEHEVEAQAILDDEAAVDVTARERIYRDEGWTRFDPDAPAYTAPEVQKERDRYRA